MNKKGADQTVDAQAGLHHCCLQTPEDKRPIESWTNRSWHAWERSGSVVECLTRDQGAAGSSLTGATALSLSKNINPSLVLVQPRKTRPFMTERLLMGRKNQIKQTRSWHD